MIDNIFIYSVPESDAFNKTVFISHHCKIITITQMHYLNEPSKGFRIIPFMIYQSADIMKKKAIIQQIIIFFNGSFQLYDKSVNCKHMPFFVLTSINAMKIRNLLHQKRIVQSEAR